MKAWAVAASLLLAGFPQAAWANIGRVTLSVPRANVGPVAAGAVARPVQLLAGPASVMPTASLTVFSPIPLLPTPVIYASNPVASFASPVAVVGRGAVFVPAPADAPAGPAGTPASESPGADIPSETASEGVPAADVGAAPVASAQAALPRNLRELAASVLAGWTRGKAKAEPPVAAEMGALHEGPLSVPQAPKGAASLRRRAASEGPAGARQASRGITRVWLRPTLDPLAVRLEDAPVASPAEALPQAMAELLDGPLSELRTRRQLRGLDRAGRAEAALVHARVFDGLVAEARGAGARAAAATVAAHVLARTKTMPYEELRYALGPETTDRLLALEAGARALGRRVGSAPLERLRAAAPAALEKAARRVLLGVPAKGAPFRMSWRLVGVIILFAPGKSALAVYLASQFIPGFSAEAFLEPLASLPAYVVAGAPVWLWGALAAGAAALFTLYRRFSKKAAAPINTDETPVP